MQAGIRPEDFRFDKSIDMIVMIIVGGLGSVSGAAIGVRMRSSQSGISCFPSA